MSETINCNQKDFDKWWLEYQNVELTPAKLIEKINKRGLSELIRTVAQSAYIVGAAQENECIAVSVNF